MRAHLLAAAALCSSLLAGAGVARAEPPTMPVVIAPFRTRCFDVARLRERIVELNGSLRVLDRPPATSHLEVVLDGGEPAWHLRLTSRDASGAARGSETRALPATTECAELLEAAALIVVRSATPMHAAEEKPPAARPTQIAHPTKQTARPTPHPTTEIVPAPVAVPTPVPVTAPDPVAAPVDRQPSAVSRLPSPSAVSRQPSAVSRQPSPVAAAVPVADRRHLLRPTVELGLRAAWTFPLDGVPSTPSGALALGLGFGRFGLVLAAAVTGEAAISASSDEGVVRVGLRGVPIALQARVDLRVGRGAFRIAAGPALLVWVVRDDGVEAGGTHTLLEPGAVVSGAYRLPLGRFDLEGGLTLTAAFVRDTLTVEGLGALGHTSAVSLAPYLGAGLRL